MKTIIMSDLHIGDPRHKPRHQPIQNLLEKKEFDRLILNGDIIDLWADSLENIKKDEFFRFLCSLALEKEVIWVIGNHDSDIRYFPYLMPNAHMCDFYMLDDQDKILVLHGNHFYPHENMAWYSKVASVLNLWVWKITRWLGRKWNYEGFNLQSRITRRGFWYEQYAKTHRQKLLKEYSDNENVDAIVMGHTHLVSYQKYVIYLQ